MIKRYISPSLLAANPLRLQEAVDAVVAAGVTRLHLDFMDHHFVPNLHGGPALIAPLRARYPTLYLEVHLMVTDPLEGLIARCAEAGASLIVIHPEATHHLHRQLQWIRTCGAAAGVALNPSTGLEMLPWVLETLDHVLLMSVNPGFGGQRFLPATLHKARLVRALCDGAPHPVTLGMDGGLNIDTLPLVVAAGVEICIVGQGLFGFPDPDGGYQTIVRTLSEHLESARR